MPATMRPSCPRCNATRSEPGCSDATRARPARLASAFRSLYAIAVGSAHGERVPPPPNDGLEPLRERVRVASEPARARCLLPPPRQLRGRCSMATFGGVDHRQLPDRPLRLVDDALEDRSPRTREPLHRRPLEEVRVEHESAQEPILARIHLEVEIELRSPGLEVELGEVPARRQRRHRRLDREEHLIERIATGITRWSEFADEKLEREQVVRKDVQHDLPDAPQMLAERGVAGHVRPQHDRVEEAAQEAFELDPLPVAANGAQDQVVLSAVAAEKDLEGREQQHERGNPLTAGHRAESPHVLCREPKRHHRSGKRLRARSWVIGGQVDRGGCSGELPARVVEFLDGDPIHLAPLPIGDVRVLGGKIGERRLLSVCAECVVERRQLREEDAVGRDTVEDHVVEREVETVLGVVQAHHQTAEERHLA